MLHVRVLAPCLIGLVYLIAVSSCAPSRANDTRPQPIYGQTEIPVKETPMSAGTPNNVPSGSSPQTPPWYTPFPTPAPVTSPYPGGYPGRDPGDVGTPLPGAGAGSGSGGSTNSDPQITMAIVHFDFDRAVIRSDDKQLLDQLIRSLDSFNEISKIRVTGYADRFGSDAYNLRLSKRRAIAVQNYLLDRSKTLMREPLKSMLIEIRAKGRIEASTDCPSGRPRRERIDCMQPDRRAEVEVEVAIPSRKLD